MEKSAEIIKFDKKKDLFSLIPEYNYVINKSNPLVFLNFEDWTVLEVNLFEIYLSKINSKNVESSYVIISKKEAERILNIKRINNSSFVDTYESLLKKQVKIGKDKYKNISFNIFEAKAVNVENGDIMIALSCTNTAKEFLFNVADLGYIKYKLREAILLPTIFSKMLYYIFLYEQNWGKWEPTEEELRKILGCENKYTATRELIRAVINPSIEYINIYTELNVEYERIIGPKNKTLGFIFNISKKANYREIVSRDGEKYIESDKIKDNILTLITDTLKVSKKDAETIISKADENNITSDELQERIKYINARKGKIKKVTGYMLTILDKNKWQNVVEEKENNVTDIRSNDFNNFEQKKLDDELDEMEELFLREVNEPNNENTGSK